MTLTPLQKQNQIKSLQHAIQILEGIPTSTPCAACVEFSAGFCNQFRANVPPDFQVQGCVDFAEVPF
jgi:hypothetical protein